MIKKYINNEQRGLTNNINVNISAKIIEMRGSKNIQQMADMLTFILFVLIIIRKFNVNFVATVLQCNISW